MKTVSFIGSDKNAGKTTALNWYLSEKCKTLQNSICLTSIGINGESSDEYEGTQKPSILIKSGNLFFTAARHLTQWAGFYKTLLMGLPPQFDQHFVLGEALFDFPLILEGPNHKKGLLHLKSILSQLELNQLIIDGSIDRQFIAHHDISDEFCFSLLLSRRPEQLKKAADLLLPVRLHSCGHITGSAIDKHKTVNTKSMLLDKENNLVYIGEKIAFLDQDLKKQMESRLKHQGTLYLNSALSRGLYKYLAPFRNLRLVLDNFTMYQNINVHELPNLNFLPDICLKNSIKIHSIFLNEQGGSLPCKLPEKTPVFNLYREIPDAV
jgi:hypothetical protein